VHNADLILTLTAALTAALGLGFLALRLKLPPIVGYLLAGLLIGPHTPGFVANRQLAEQLAEVGVILLMFGVGLQFHLKDLRAVQRIAIPGALIKIAAATAAGALAVRGFGWTLEAGIVFGIALSVASTVVLTRVLEDSGQLQSPVGRIAIGWLVVEDVFTVFVMVALPAVVGPAAGSVSLPVALATTLLKLGALSFVILGPGARLLPRLLTLAARTRSRELFTLTVLVVALGLAVGASTVFGVSMALGAFLAGMVVGQSEFSARAASEALPMRDAFAVIFFVSVGMLFDPQRLVVSLGLTAATVAVVLLGKPLFAVLVALLLGCGARNSWRLAVAMAQIGEFSFMLAMVGRQLEVLPPEATDALVAASILSITLNPLLYRSIAPLERFVRRSRIGRLLGPGPDPAATAVEAAAARAIVVGFGPVGQSVTRLLAGLGIVAAVVELNIDTVRQLQSSGTPAVYGDAAHPEVLKQAGLAEAVALVLSAPGSRDSVEIIRAAREAKPGILVLARSAFLSDAAALREAGADQVFSGEAEVATAMIDVMLRRLGATPEQTDMERERARALLYGTGG
jgi:monovalent cation:H+ antiporter-2, CPA2 family